MIKLSQLVELALFSFEANEHLCTRSVAEMVAQATAPEAYTGYDLNNIATVVNGDTPVVLLLVDGNWKEFDCRNQSHLGVLACVLGVMYLTDEDTGKTNLYQIGNEDLGTYYADTPIQMFWYILSMVS